MVEMLVATLLAGIVMSAGTKFFSYQLAAMRAERGRRAAQMTARTAVNFLGRQLEHVGRDPQRALFTNLDNTGLPPAIVNATGTWIRYRTNLSQDLEDQDTLDAWEDVTISHANGVVWVAQGGGGAVALTDSTIVGSHVGSGGLTFDYFDANGTAVTNLAPDAARASVRRIRVTLTVTAGPLATSTGSTPRATLSQDVFLRNVS
jgi:hypothetical protein